jgi:hypothetical protein
MARGENGPVDHFQCRTPRHACRGRGVGEWWVDTHPTNSIEAEFLVDVMQGFDATGIAVSDLGGKFGFQTSVKSRLRRIGRAGQSVPEFGIFAGGMGVD